MHSCFPFLYYFPVSYPSLLHPIPLLYSSQQPILSNPISSLPNPNLPVASHAPSSDCWQSRNPALPHHPPDNAVSSTRTDSLFASPATPSCTPGSSRWYPCWAIRPRARNRECLGDMERGKCQTGPAVSMRFYGYGLLGWSAKPDGGSSCFGGW